MNEPAQPVEERIWLLDVNGMRIASGTASPGSETALAAGHLVADGFITDITDVLTMETHDATADAVRIDVRLTGDAFARGTRAMEHARERGCGPLHYVTCGEGRAAAERPAGFPTEESAVAMLRELFDACDRACPGGGVHAAALFDGESVLHVHVDVARHSAVEKAVGGAFLEGGLPIGAGLVMTARISGRIAHVAARAGIPWIVSRSLPTTIAVRVAAHAGTMIFARTGGRSARVFTADVPMVSS
jgi:FdhD protein